MRKDKAKKTDERKNGDIINMLDSALILFSA